MTNIEVAFSLAFASFFLGAFLSVFFYKKDKLANLFGNTFAVIGSFFGFLASGNILLGQTGLLYRSSLKILNIPISLNFDRLSSFFILIISCVAFFSSIYALGYAKHYYGKYNLGVLGFFYNIFIASMLLVVSADNFLFFLFVWEIMSLSSYFLVIYENREENNIDAGTLYFVMTHLGTAFIILAAFILYKVSGSFGFEAIRVSSTLLTPFLKNIVLLFLLIGFGTKSGIIPLHIWLPSAHPAAPTHVSALMSGVMIKTGIYMLIRVAFDLLSGIPIWFGLVVLFVGAISSVLGVLYALSEHDIKRLLAYHSIENIGIILLGLGSSLVFYSLNLKSLAVLGLVASLYHTMNHAIFKSLLFLGAGSVISETHTRNIEEYGGLIKKMPQTAFFFLIGSMAISALPPFNGFFSEWLTFGSLFQGVLSFDLATKIFFAFMIGALALTSGLAAACFVKAFGIIFLARPRSGEAIKAKESPFSMRIGMASLSFLTLFIGVSTGYVSGMLSDIVKSLPGIGSELPFKILTTEPSIVKIGVGFSSISAPFIFVSIVLFLALSSLFVWLLSGNQKMSFGRTWDCGTDLTGRMEITATGFSRSIITVFKKFLRPITEKNEVASSSGLKYFPAERKVEVWYEDIYRNNLYGPLGEFVGRVSNTVKKIQSGNINEYVLYVFIALITLMIIFIS